MLASLLPILPLYWLKRVLRDPRYRHGLAERLGLLPGSYQRTVQRPVWLHAVSVGEVISSVELIRRWNVEHPDWEVFVSCATVAGREVAEARLKSLTSGIFYVPVDYVFAVRRVLRRIRPALVVVMETEIWPNLWQESKRSGARLVIVNGRISDRALPRYRKWRALFAPILSLPDAMLVQSLRDRDRYLELGAQSERVECGGNLKYDFNPGQSTIPRPIAELLDQQGQRPIWIAASTMPPLDDTDIDEDDAVLNAFIEARRTIPDLFLILVPRKPERFELAAGKLAAAQLRFVRRSALPAITDADVLLLDSMGELSALFSRAGVVFMGGTLACRGGHNILEPAFFGKPIIIGPHMENFSEIARAFKEASALCEIATPAALAEAVVRLLRSPGELGAQARVAAEAQRGATGRALAVMTREYDWSLPRALPCWPLWLVSRVWLLGGKWKRALTRTRKLPAPVLSVGGVGMGGAGKTPVVDYLATRFAAEGARVAILTRGYGRANSKPVLLSPGSRAPVSDTGDEAQIYLRSGRAAVGIAADRFEAGRHIQAELFLLDDGFQHARLHRDLDLVVLDALDPFAGAAPFPLGRMREGFDALRRAHVFLLHRADPARLYPAIHKLLPASVPVFYSRVVPECWIDSSTGERRPLNAFHGQRTAAFCGLANPMSFWDTLATLGYSPEFRTAFPDHYRYRSSDFEELRRPGAVLLTTEKDAVKLPPQAGIWYLRIGITVDQESAFLRTVDAVCGISGREPR